MILVQYAERLHGRQFCWLHCLVKHPEYGMPTLACPLWPDGSCRHPSSACPAMTLDSILPRLPASHSCHGVHWGRAVGSANNSGDIGRPVLPRGRLRGNRQLWIVPFSSSPQKGDTPTISQISLIYAVTRLLGSDNSAISQDILGYWCY